MVNENILQTKKVDEAAKIKNTDIAAELCLPPVKCEILLDSLSKLTRLTVLVVHCSLLAEDAIKAAIANYQSKRVGAAATNLAQTSKAFAKETDGLEVIQ
jgi:NifU-like protein involved in Fe-S cluster formation